MPHYKLTYFDCTGLGEAIRFLFAYGGIKYEDIRVPFDEFYKTVKKELPFGRAPILEIDGKVVAQSTAIARYLAIQVGLYGKDAWEGLLIDEAVGHIDDFRVKISTSYWEPDSEKKIQKMNDIKADHIPYYLTRFESIVGENGGYFALGRITLADIFFTSFLNYFNTLTEMNILQGHPNLAKLVAEVEELPGIKEWIETRPIGFVEIGRTYSEMAEYKFKYLDLTALGEVSRYLFAYGGIKFDDIRVSFDSYMNKDDAFMELKKELPFGLLPTLEFDGKLYTQSAAIARYLAIKVGLYGNNPLEGLLIDEAYGNIDDLRCKFSHARYADPALQPALFAELKSTHMPYYLSRFEKIVGETGGHFAIPRWNLADILFGSYLLYMNTIAGEDVLQGYPNLQKLAAELEALPGIKEYLQNRPKTVA